MKSKLLPFLIASGVLLGSTTSESGVEQSDIDKTPLKLEEYIKTLPKQETIQDINFADSVASFLTSVAQSKEIIRKSNEVLILNEGYQANLKVKQEVLEETLDTLIVEVTKVIEQEVIKATREVLIDSICISQRGFIGHKIFGKDKCKKWLVREYYLDSDSVKVYLDK